MSKSASPILVGILCVMIGISGFCLYQYIFTAREKELLGEQLDRIRQNVRALESEKSALILDIENVRQSEKSLILQNTGLADQVKSGHEKVLELEATLMGAQSNIEALNEQISIAREESAALVAQIDGLKSQITVVKQDNDQMSECLSSIDSLKKVIKELKRKAREERRRKNVRVVKRKNEITVPGTAAVVEEISLGNQGFIIKNGQATFPSRIKIEVQPSPELSQ